MSKELDALEELIVVLKTNTGTKQYSDIFEINLIKPIEKALKAFEIIKNKNFDLFYLLDSRDLEDYNDKCDCYRNLNYLTQEEYDSLKEALK